LTGKRINLEGLDLGSDQTNNEVNSIPEFNFIPNNTRESILKGIFENPEFPEVS